MKDTTDYRIERLSDENFSDFLELFQIGFGKQSIDTELLTNKFKTGYTGLKYLGFLAYSIHDDKAAAYCGAYPIKVLIRDKMAIAAQFADPSTHPEHRRKGLFKLLHDKTIELCKQEGVAFVFGFTAKETNSYKGLKSFGWEDVTTVDKISCKLEVPLFLKILRKASSSLFNKYQQTILKKHSRSVDKLVESGGTLRSALNLQSSNHFIRNKEYIEYKLRLSSKLLELPSGVAWVKLNGNQLHIGDLFGRDLNDLFLELRSIARKIGFDVVLLSTCNVDVVESLNADRTDSGARLEFIIKHLSEEQLDRILSCTGGDFDTF